MPEEMPYINEGEEGQYTFLDPADENYYPAASDYTKIPNRFVERYANVSYLANMGLMMAINRVEERKKELYAGTQEGFFFKEVHRLTGTDFSDGLVAEFPISEFIKVFSLNTGGRVYQQIDSLYNGDLLRNQWQILYEDENICASSAVIIGTMYNKKNKRMYLKFHPDLAPVITNIKSDYATIPLPVIGKLKDDFISQLYQVLKKRLDFELSRNRKYHMYNAKEVKTTFSIDQFYFMMGVFPLDLSSDDNDMQKVVQLLKNKDYETAANIERESGLIDRFDNSDNKGGNSKKLALTRFGYFREKYLDKAFRKINGFTKPKSLEKVGANPMGDAYDEYVENCRTKHPTDIHFRYELIKSGLGGKVSGISFYISKADWNDHEDSDEAEPKPVVDELEFILEMKDIIKEKITAQGFRAIAEAAQWDIGRVTKAYKVASEQKPKDITAFMIAAINGDWEPADGTEPEEEKQIHKYTVEEVKEALRFNTVCNGYLDEDNSEEEDTLEVFMRVIADFLNSEDETIKLNRTTLMTEDVKQKIMGLGNEELATAVKSFLSAKTKSVSDKYILTILYNVDKQRDLKDAQTAARSRAKKKHLEEAYPREFIDKQLHYQEVVLMAEGCKDEVDSVFNIIYDALNNTADTIRIGKGEMPAAAVKSRLLKLNAFDTVTAIKNIIDSGHSDIVTPTYILTILYMIHDQELLANSKDLAEDGYKDVHGTRWREGKQSAKSEDNNTDYVPDTSNRFNQFHQTKYSQKDYDDLEYRKLTEYD